MFARWHRALSVWEKRQTEDGNERVIPSHFPGPISFCTLVWSLLVTYHMLLREARDVLQRERRKVSAERDAFEMCGRRIATLAPTSHAAQQGGGAMQIITPTQTETQTSEVVTAYEETVLQTEHYESEYGEEPLVHLGIELGREYAEVLQTETYLSPQLRQGLLMALTDAQQRRERFQKILEEENATCEQSIEFLSEFQPQKMAVEAMSFDQLCQADTHLQEDIAQIESFLAERQDELHRSSANGVSRNRVNPKSLNQYLYGSLDTEYPILDALLRQLDEIRDVRDAIAQEIATYDGRDE